MPVYYVSSFDFLPHAGFKENPDLSTTALVSASHDVLLGEIWEITNSFSMPGQRSDQFTQPLKLERSLDHSTTNLFRKTCVSSMSRIVSPRKWRTVKVTYKNIYLNTPAISKPPSWWAIQYDVGYFPATICLANLKLLYLIFFSSAIYAFAGIDELGSHLDRRQNECTTPCSWLVNVQSCSTTDNACICSVFESAGSAVASCESCIQSFNATLASGIEQVAQFCSSLAPAPAPAPGPTSPSGSCDTPCSWTSGLNSCSDLTCVCGVLNLAGPAVASCETCLQKVNVTLAADLDQLIQGCNTPSSAPAPASTTSASTPASSPAACFSGSCGWLNGIEICGDNDMVCFCQVLNSAGSGAIGGCESCVDTFNVTFASEISQLAQQCETVALSSTITSVPTSSPPITSSKTTTTTKTGSTFPSSTSLASGASDVFGDTLNFVGYFQFVMFLAAVVGLVDFL